MTDLKKTSLHHLQKSFGAKFINFFDWEMPIFFDSTIKEHLHVRTTCGVFDVGHMGQFAITGPDALKFLEWTTSQSLSLSSPGDSHYTLLLNNEGGIQDDLILYHLEKNSFLLCVNASRTESDFEWFNLQTKGFDVSIENLSSQLSLLAVQGPKSLEVMKQLYPQLDEKLGKLPFTKLIPLGPHQFISRTGYSGEQGFEIYVQNQDAPKLYTNLLEHPLVKPIGLGARDSLRLEAGFPLYGQDMDTKTLPIEAGLSWATKPKVKDFIGKKALLDTQPKTKIYNFFMEDKAIPISSMIVKDLNHNNLGVVTSGAYLPTLEKGGGKIAASKLNLDDNSICFIDVRGQLKKAVLIAKPLYPSKAKESFNGEFNA